MSILEVIKERKSIRKYSTKEVKDEDLIKILEAGRLAPSARNEQCWKFIIVKDEDLRHKMVEVCGEQQFLKEAPINLVVCANNDKTMACGQPARTVDCSIALSFMILQATELGLGTCWLGKYNNDKVKELLNIPEEYNVIAITPIGYAAEEVTFRPRKDLEEIVVLNSWK